MDRYMDAQITVKFVEMLAEKGANRQDMKTRNKSRSSCERGTELLFSFGHSKLSQAKPIQTNKEKQKQKRRRTKNNEVTAVEQSSNLS